MLQYRSWHHVTMMRTGSLALALTACPRGNAPVAHVQGASIARPPSGENPSAGTANPNESTGENESGDLSIDANAGFSPAVAGHVDEIKAALRRCYQAQLTATPGLTGKVIARFTIDPAGTVVSSNATGLEGVDTCIADAIKKISFTPTGVAADVTIPFLLLPQP